jgi:SAM-dependent methyltransferase
MRKKQFICASLCHGAPLLLVLLLASLGASYARQASPDTGRENPVEYTLEDALRMIRASQDRLAPVYGPLAEHLVKELGLRGKNGIGIDIGSGPGSLIVELCRHTEMHWINADVNPHFFGYFMRQVKENGFPGRASAMRADVHDLPFRDNLADVIVSRGSFWLWRDKPRAFKEILRVLKPGGIAYIGRGFSENLPLDTARGIRAGGGGKIRYDVDETEAELRQIMVDLEIQDHVLIRPRVHSDAGVNYGV